MEPVLPVIVLVGRPNVGKSTLFNRLTRRRDALVADTPGLTRDRQYGIGKVGPRPYIVADTGGLSGEPDALAVLMAEQVQRAIAESDHLLFLVDAHDGCTTGDLEISARLRREGKPLTLVVNKIDERDPDLAASEFHLLGLGMPVPIAAVQGRGVTALMEQVLATLPQPPPAPEEATDPERIRVAIVGRPNAGKSTLINRLLGEERVIAHDSPGTTRDSLFLPYERFGRRYTLIDTAGVRRRSRVDDTIEKFSIIKTLQAIEACHVVILVVDARAGIGEHDATLAGHILESGRALVVAVNKWDGLDAEQRTRVKSEFERKLAFLDFAARHFVSALHGTGVGLLLDDVERAHANTTRDLSTPELTRLLEAAVQQHQPPLVRGRRIKLRYAHQGGRNPPRIIVHGTQTEAVPETYRRYLVNHFRQALELQGTPLRIELRSTTNPYAGKRNVLTLRQIKKRRRLRDHVARRR